MKTFLVTGSSGLIGCAACVCFGRELDATVHGVDINQGAVFFGSRGDRRWTDQRRQRDLRGFAHCDPDVRELDHQATVTRQDGTAQAIVWLPYVYRAN